MIRPTGSRNLRDCQKIMAKQANRTRVKLECSFFDVYGYKFSISGTPGVALTGACQDFAYFKNARAVIDLARKTFGDTEN
jgi:hypothetical protein